MSKQYLEKGRASEPAYPDIDVLIKLNDINHNSWQLKRFCCGLISFSYYI